MNHKRAATPPQPAPPLQESPDPLALRPSTSKALSAITPRKRKQGAHAESPSLKRVQSNSFVTPHKSLTPLTSIYSQTSTASASTTASKSRTILAFVEVPPLPKEWRTPSQKSVNSLSTKMQGKMKVDDTPDDLGGYGSVDEDSFSPQRYDHSPTKSSARRTGDRDERGTLLTRSLALR